MGRAAFLTKRGNCYWFRGRIPVVAPCDMHGIAYSLGVSRTTPKRADLGHITLSLRTSCPREARRRAIRLAALFEHAWTLFEDAAQRDKKMEEPESRRKIARALLQIMQDNTAIARRVSDNFLPSSEESRSLERADAHSRVRIQSLFPPEEAPVAQAGATPRISDNPLDDPEFIAALEDQIDPDVSEEDLFFQFDAQLGWLTHLLSVYIQHCAVLYPDVWKFALGWGHEPLLGHAPAGAAHSGIPWSLLNDHGEARMDRRKDTAFE
ncbi:DUF6538 domain-containing protein, partial [Pararhodobacter sp. SW119]|uniref:DUF6538 domain-containing protein n=1 Tax=Pararhodobacter sp. SW119 TaxID=2780075 RepID=UPI001ADF24AE